MRFAFWLPRAGLAANGASVGRAGVDDRVGPMRFARAEARVEVVAAST